MTKCTQIPTGMVSPGPGLLLAAPKCEGTQKVATTVVEVEAFTPTVDPLKGMPRQSLFPPPPLLPVTYPNPPNPPPPTPPTPHLPIFILHPSVVLNRDLSCVSNLPVSGNLTSTHATDDIRLNFKVVAKDTAQLCLTQCTQHRAS